MKNTFDAILASVPSNATAARVVSQTGDHYDPVVNFGSLMHWSEPPPCITPPLTAQHFIDHRGKKFGEFTVVGYLGRLNPNKKALWLVKCSCGDYEARHPATITLLTADPACNDRCCKCGHWQSVKRRYAKKGARPLADFIASPESKASNLINARRGG